MSGLAADVRLTGLGAGVDAGRKLGRDPLRQAAGRGVLGDRSVVTTVVGGMVQQPLASCGLLGYWVEVGQAAVAPAEAVVLIAAGLQLVAGVGGAVGRGRAQHDAGDDGVDEDRQRVAGDAVGAGGDVGGSGLVRGGAVGVVGDAAARVAVPGAAAEAPGGRAAHRRWSCRWCRRCRSRSRTAEPLQSVAEGY